MDSGDLAKRTFLNFYYEFGPVGPCLYSDAVLLPFGRSACGAAGGGRAPIVVTTGAQAACVWRYLVYARPFCS